MILKENNFFRKMFIVTEYAALKKKKTSSNKITIFFENYNLTPQHMYHGLSEVYCTKPEGINL